MVSNYLLLLSHHSYKPPDKYASMTNITCVPQCQPLYMHLNVLTTPPPFHLRIRQIMTPSNASSLIYSICLNTPLLLALFFSYHSEKLFIHIFKTPSPPPIHFCPLQSLDPSNRPSYTFGVSPYKHPSLH